MVDVQGGGSSAGITAVETGVADVGMSSRALKESEERLWSVVIAKDGLALIVHPDNPIDNLSLRQVLDIYTGRVTNWNELGGEDKKIHLVAREEGSGTRSAFQDLVMADESITPKAIVQNTNGAVKQFVSGNPNAIGFISLGLVDEQVKALYLDGVSPTQINVLNGSYGLFRPFLFVSNYEPEGQVKKFIDYVLSDEGQQVLIDEGLVSLREGAGE
jgi:phosphate transport system substrate-binding protein